MSKDFCVVLASTSGESGLGKERKPTWLCVFTPLKRSGFGSNQERALEVCIPCASFFKCLSPDSGGFEHQQKPRE